MYNFATLYFQSGYCELSPRIFAQILLLLLQAKSDFIQPGHFFSNVQTWLKFLRNSKSETFRLVPQALNPRQNLSCTPRLAAIFAQLPACSFAKVDAINSAW